MSSNKQAIRYRKERCILSDVLPYEVPLTFTNRHFYDFICRHRIEFKDGILSWKKSSPALDHLVLLTFSLPNQILRFGTKFVVRSGRSEVHTTYDMNIDVPNTKPFYALIPFGFRIYHKEIEYRGLSVPHPRSQLEAVSFYDRYKELILYYCNRSNFSIRRPARIAKYVFHKDTTHYERITNEPMPIEQHDHEYEHLKSFFVYRDYSNVYKFYDSHKYHRCEKKYGMLKRLDISKCFDSIYTHSIAWAIYGKMPIKKNLKFSESTFPGRFDKLMQKMNYNETNGILIGPELSRIFAEILLQSVDCAVERELIVEHKLRHKTDYEIFRYVDDYFVFTNTKEDASKIEATLMHQLKEYGLHISTEKSKEYDKPIITEISRAKKRISTLFEDNLIYKLLECQDMTHGSCKALCGSIYVDAKNMIVKFKTILRECGVHYRDILNYSLAMACFEKPDPSVMKVFSLFGKETFDEYEEAKAA